MVYTYRMIDVTCMGWMGSYSQLKQLINKYITLKLLLAPLAPFVNAKRKIFHY